MAEHAKTTRAKTAELGNRFLAVSSVPEPEPESPPARQSRAAAMVRDNGPAPAEQTGGPRWGGRGAQINLTVDREIKRALGQAQFDDGIETTARIRAMIAFWMEDPRFAARVNKRAASPEFKGRNRRWP
jgi:hypothetical protein